jgi:glycosyltransferase involved in cell wall biosynthesis
MFSDSISIVIPAYNEQATIVAVVDEAREVLQALTREYEVLVVDDGSTDGTGELADQAAANDPAHVRVLHHEVNRGFAGAIKTCYANASKDWVFLAPADKQVDLSELGNFVALTDGADIVVGYRKHRADGLRREANSYVFHLLCRIFFGIRLKQISTSKLYRRSLLQSLPLQAAPSSAMIEPEVIFQAVQRGARMVEVGMNHYPRAAGKPKGTGARMIFNTFGEMFRLWWVLRVAPDRTPTPPLASTTEKSR